ncbi:MAG: NfeD family protein [Gammaproteobacteria bacterium]|nr:NfeD family protein [Gammaproteobacteria bacterium]
MIEYIQTHQSGFWIALGFLLLATEVLVFGFTTIIFLFAGIGALVTGLLMSVGILPETWIAGVASFGISTGVTSIVLWKPMRKMQDDHTPAQSHSSDLIGYQFVLQEDISLMSSGSHRYSGVDWKIELDPSADADSLSSGQRVVVVSVDAGIFRVKAA